MSVSRRPVGAEDEGQLCTFCWGALAVARVEVVVSGALDGSLFSFACGPCSSAERVLRSVEELIDGGS